MQTSMKKTCFFKLQILLIFEMTVSCDCGIFWKDSFIFILRYRKFRPELLLTIRIVCKDRRYVGFHHGRPLIPSG